MTPTKGIVSAVSATIGKSDLDSVWRERGLQAMAGMYFVIEGSWHVQAEAVK